jgi:hypothetical protein
MSPEHSQTRTEYRSTGQSTRPETLNSDAIQLKLESLELSQEGTSLIGLKNSVNNMVRTISNRLNKLYGKSDSNDSRLYDLENP